METSLMTSLVILALVAAAGAIIFFAFAFLHPLFQRWRDDRPTEVREYDTMFGGEDRRKAIALAKEIRDAQAGDPLTGQDGVVTLETQHLQAVRELRRLKNIGAPAADITNQETEVDRLATRLRDAQTHVEEMRAYARFFYREYFTR